MVEPTIPTVTSGQLAQSSSQWNTAVTKIQSLTDGHRHDGVGSYGPLSNFSAASFTQISTGGLNTSGNVVAGGTLTASGLAGFGQVTIASNISGAGTLVIGNTSVAGTLTVNSAFTAGVIVAPGNLSGSGIVSQLVAGSNITLSGASGVGVVAIGVGGTTVFAGANQSFGTVVQGSTLDRYTFQVSGQTTLAGLILDNLSATGSVYVQSRFTANDSILIGNLSAATVNVSSALTAGQVNTSALAVGLLSTGSLNVSGTTTLQVVTASSLVVNSASIIGNLSLGSLVATSTGTFAGVTVTSGWNTSFGGNLTVQSRMAANDGAVNGNFSAGSLYSGSSILLNVSSNLLTVVSAQIGTLINTSMFANVPVNTSVGTLRVWATSAGRGYVSVNAQPTGTADVALAGQWQQYFDQQSPPNITWQLGSNASFITPMVLYSSGLVVTNNISAGSITAGTVTLTTFSSNTAIIGSAQIVNLTVSGQTTGAASIWTGNMSLGGTLNISGITNEQTVNTSTLTTGSLTAGNIHLPSRTVTASTNTSANDYMIVVNQSSLSVGVSLARAASSIGQLLTVYQMSGSGTVTTYATSTDQLKFTGASTDALTNEAAHRYYALNNSSWIIW